MIPGARDDVDHLQIPGNHDFLHLNYITFIPARKFNSHSNSERTMYSQQPVIRNDQDTIRITIFSNVLKDLITVHPSTKGYDRFEGNLTALE